MADEKDEKIPSSWIEEGLFDHLVVGHGTHPDKLQEIKESVPEEFWLSILIRSHFILHKVDENGEYHDEYFHYSKEEQ